MALEVCSSSRSPKVFFDSVLQKVEKIKEDFGSPELNFPKIDAGISVLGRQIQNYLDAGVPLKSLCCSFFVFELRKATAQMIYHKDQNEWLIDLVKKVGRATSCLQQVLSEENQENSLTRLEGIEQYNIQSIFNGAIEQWDVEKLSQLLEQYSFSASDTDKLVDKALDKKELEKISFPLMLHHFKALSKKSQEKVEMWIQDKMFSLGDLAADLYSLEESLQQCLNKSYFNPGEISQKVSLKQELDPVVDSISQFFSKIPKEKQPKDFEKAKQYWETFLMAWKDEKFSVDDKRRSCVQQIRSLINGGDLWGSIPFISQIPEDEEKHDTRALYEELQKAIQNSDAKMLKKLIDERFDLYHLSTQEIRTFLKEASVLPSSDCLAQLLQHSSFSNLESSTFSPLLQEVLDEKLWNAAGLLMQVSAFKPDAIKLPPSAPETLLVLMSLMDPENSSALF